MLKEKTVPRSSLDICYTVKIMGVGALNSSSPCTNVWSDSGRGLTDRSRYFQSN